MCFYNNARAAGLAANMPRWQRQQQAGGRARDGEQFIPERIMSLSMSQSRRGKDESMIIMIIVL